MAPREKDNSTQSKKNLRKQEYIECEQISSLFLTEELYEPQHEISNNVVCATSKCSDQPSHTRSLIRAFPSRLIIL